VRQFSLPPIVEPLTSGGLADSVYETADRTPDLPQLARRDEADGDRWHPVTAAAFRDEVLALAAGLLADGLRVGDPVAVMARTRYEWTLFSYALWSVGAVVVPIYPTSSTEQVRAILCQTRAVGAVVEHEDHAITVGAVCDFLPRLGRIWQLDADCVRSLTDQGRDIPEDLVHQRRGAVEPDGPAVIAYTCGTTGHPRGCVITHANLVAECDTLLAGWKEILARPGQQPSVLAFLPLAHVYGLMVQVGCLRGGILLGHQPDLAAPALLPALASFRPTSLFAVPYFFERIFDDGRRAAQHEGRGALFDRAVDVAARYAEAGEHHRLGTGPGPGPMLSAAHRVFEHMVYRRLRAVLGGRVRVAMSGGSPLSRRLALVFAGAGVTLYEGYGLTETTASVTAQPVGRVRFGTVGRPIPGHAVRIAPDGEVLVRGPVVFAGYLGDPAATKETLSDGWLATGDTGHLESDGYLVITGRKKDVIITSGGKSVSPLILEERLRAHPLVSQCVVVGDARPYVAALITLDPDALGNWLRLHGKDATDRPGPATWPADEDLRAVIARAVAAANTAVSRAESIRTFRILRSEFQIADGLLTPSLKLRRAAVVAAYADEIEAMYASPPPARP
jgi:long-chain acyl-CoA synthetase